MYLCVLSRVAPLHILRSNCVTGKKWGWVWTRYSCLKTDIQKRSPLLYGYQFGTLVVNGISAGYPLLLCLGTGVCSMHLWYIQLVTKPCMCIFLLQAAHKIALCHPKFIHLWSSFSQAMDRGRWLVYPKGEKTLCLDMAVKSLSRAISLIWTANGPVLACRAFMHCSRPPFPLILNQSSN